MPVQCPECARFLSNAFVAGLQKGPAPCPKCETELRSQQFEDAEGNATTPVADRGSTGSAVAGEGSVRPPDLAPATVRDGGPDPLAGWDRHGDAGPMVGLGPEHDPAATGAAIGVGGVVGALIGAVAADRSVLGALVGGAIGGALAAAGAHAIARRQQVHLIE